ncbi:transposase [Oscillospiraceae bacterium 50-60]
MEHTGRYYEPAAQFLHDAGLYVSAVNPKLIKDYRNNSLRKVKTDKADSRKIAKYGLDNRVELRQYASMNTIRYQLKTLNRQCNLYTKMKTMMKNNLIALLDQTYRQPCTRGWNSEVGGFCCVLLACGLCAWHEPDCIHRALPQMVQAERI